MKGECIMKYTITIDNQTYKFELSTTSDYNYAVSMALSQSDDIKGIPVNLASGDIAPSGSVFADYSDTDEYTWIPFPYLWYDLRTSHNSNLYTDILDGVVTKDNIDKLSFGESGKCYVKENFDKYVAFSRILVAAQTISSEGKDLSKEDIDKILQSFECSTLVLKSEIIKSTQEAISKARSKASKQPTSTPPQQESSDTANGKTRTAQVINDLIGKGQQSVRSIPRHPADQAPAPKGVATPNMDGTVTLDYSNIPVQPETTPTPIQPQTVSVPAVNVPASFDPAVMVQTPVTPPPVGNQPREVVAPTTHVAKSKSDIVDNPAPAVIAPDTTTADPLASVQETESDVLVKKYPQLKLYEQLVGDQFTCEFYLNGKLISVRVHDKNDSNDSGIESMGATFDVAGAILSPETNKFWVGNDPDIIYDFENPLKLTEDVVRAYLNGEEFTEDMYYSNTAVCELNKQFNVRSIWEYVSEADQATETMQHIKKLFGLPKSKQVKKKLTGRRLSMNNFTDPTHFELVTHPGTPDYLGGSKVNEGKTIFKLIINGDDMKLEPAKNIA